MRRIIYEKIRNIVAFILDVIQFEALVLQLEGYFVY